MQTRPLLAPLTLGLLVLGTTHALAWGSMGHREIGSIAMANLPPEIPAFLRTPEVAQQVGELSREPDRSRGAGQPHDRDLDPGHFVDVDDAGKINGGPALAALPTDREGYEAALHAVGTDGFRSGYLPYNIEDGYQQLVKDFAYWRLETAALKTTTKPEDRAWIARDRTLREQLIIRDLGVWSHFVGDGSQPLHVSVHFNGWGDYPNPKGYTQDKIHAPFEGEFVSRYVTPAMVQADMRPYQPCTAGLAACTARYLQATNHWVEPLYTLWKAGDFANGNPKGVAFTAARLADAASELRDMTVDAWRASEDQRLGYRPATPPARLPGMPPPPPGTVISVRAAEAGTPVPIGILYGDD